MPNLDFADLLLIGVDHNEWAQRCELIEIVDPQRTSASYSSANR